MSAANAGWPKWIEKADHDFRAVELLSGAAEPLWDTVAFHAQQGAEKYLKGFLVLHGQDPPKTHDLVKLIELCGAIDSALLEFTSDAAFLSPLAVLSRYPDSPGEPSKIDAERGIAIAHRIREAVRKRLPQEGA